ncbi:MAG: sugar ABC transporter substrate-binding protein, partial [Ignavibacteria bacterium]|nr:sugar ABC transporter substrate-binding protein [Ignavibacteria bacterium]
MSSKIFKYFLLPAVIIQFCFSFSCNKEEDNITTLKFWAMGSEAEVVTKLIPEFEKQNPDIKVHVQQMPWTAAQEKLITAVASDNTPDLCQLGNTWIPQFAALNSITPLDELISKSPLIKKENYFEGIWETNVIGNKVYGVPWYVDTRIMFYRKDIFQKAGYDHPPKTWKELLNLSRKIKALYKGEDKYAIYLPTNEWAPFVIFGLQAGAGLLKDQNSRGNFSSKEFKEAFDYLVNFHKEKLAPIGISQVTNVYQAFADEYFSMYISGPWNIPEFKKWMKGSLADKWSTAPLPGYQENEYPGVSLAGGSSLIIFNNSEHKEEAWRLIEFLSQPVTQIEFYKLLNDLPAIKEAWNDPALKDDPYMKAFYEQFFHVVATPKVPEWEQIAFSKVQQYAELAARGVMSVDEALKGLDDDVDRILEKRRWII